MFRSLYARWGEFAVETLIRVLGFSTVAFVLLIFLFLLREGLPAFFTVDAANLFGARWYPTFDLFGTLPLILGSVVVTVTAIAVALPLRLATAVLVREVAPGWARDLLKPMFEVLAGIPSVVLGFFGIIVLAPLVRQVLGAPTGLTAFTGALILAYMALPTMISVAEDALDAVPKSYRDAALAMGATRWQTIWRVVVPAARSGILTAGMLGMGRAIGETMAVVMVTGNAARMAMRAARGEVKVGAKVEARSIIGSKFDVEYVGDTRVGNRPAVLTRVSGRSWICGLHQIGIDPTDPFPECFLLTDTWGEALDLLSSTKAQ